MNHLNTTICFLFGSPQRVIVTAVIGFILWGVVDPESVRYLTVTCWNNFWKAFGPLLQQLLQLLIVGGVIWFFVKNLFSKKK
ncbi:MAG: hypothetical protein WCV79_04485 [Candidatus Paceibacterota bacterium]|jgi:hypothetical protein